MIVFNISGTSSGAHWANYYPGEDPNLLLGAPRLIRTDEWLINQSWVISQYTQGFPVINQTLPGGMDATVLMELPNRDWSTFFRPHEWGYLLFGLDVGIAWQWWVPAVGLVSGAYLLVVTLLPRRPLTAVAIACAVFFTPIFQWWYGPNSLWPAGWSLLAMAGVIWMLRDRRTWVKVIWAVVLGWLAVTMIMGVYVPFILPSVLVFVFFLLGAVLQERPWSLQRLQTLVRRLLPLIIAGVLSIAAALLWVVTRMATFEGVTSTLYPGERTILTGQLLVLDPTLVAFNGAPFGQAFNTNSGILGGNPSDASTSILLAIFVLPALFWFILRSWRRDRRVDWLVVGSVVGLLVVLAFLFVPGWDAVARILLLDKVPVVRYRMGFAVMMPLFFALIAREVDRSKGERTWPLALTVGLFSAAFVGSSLINILIHDPITLDSSSLWPISAAGILAGVVLVFFRQTIPLAAVGLLIASLVIGGAVNPFYRGAFDLNLTEAGQAVRSIEEADPGTWVGVGSNEVMAMMMQTGVRAYNGMQTFPPEEMWKNLDPDGSEEEQWNRLAQVRWTWGSGEPTLYVPYPDAINVSLDPCSAFAQSHVDYVLADEVPESTRCLVEIVDIRQEATHMKIYNIVPPNG